LTAQLGSACELYYAVTAMRCGIEVEYAFAARVAGKESVLYRVRIVELEPGGRVGRWNLDIVDADFRSDRTAGLRLA